MSPRVKETVSERLKAKTTVQPNGCWVWTGNTNKKGYGLLSVGGRNRSCHRLVYAEQHGKIPDGLCVLHRCDNPPCINPDHLFLGTNAENNQDKIDKGRMPLGEKVGSHKLSADQVAAIRRDFRPGLSAVMAAQYGVIPATILSIVNGVWRVGESPPCEHKPSSKGAANGNAKLTAELVRSIRARHSSGETQKAIAESIGVTISAVNLVVLRKNWRHVE